MYQMQPPQPPQMPVQQEKKRMNVPQIMLIVLVLGFAVWYLVTALTPQASPYGTITASAIGSRYNGDCLIVRDETPFDAEGVNSVSRDAREGSMVYRGTKICKVYSSGFSTREMTTLQDYRNQIKEYQLKLLNAEIRTDSQLEKLESDVLSRAREVREIIRGARGNMQNQEQLLSAAITARQSYLKNKYSEDQRMARLYDDEQSQLQRISSWTKQYAAMSDGLVSFYSDGYEYGLTMTNYEQFSPAEVRDMLNGKKPGDSDAMKGKTTIYRTIQEGHWAVLMMIQDSNWNPVEGETYELKLESFQDTTVAARVRSFTRMGGSLLVRLEVESDVDPVLYIRTCSGVLGESASSLAVPQKALYYQDNMPGIVLVEGGYEWFVPIRILQQQGGMLYIAAIQQGVLYEGQTVRLF